MNQADREYYLKQAYYWLDSIKWWMENYITINDKKHMVKLFDFLETHIEWLEEDLKK